MKIFKRLSSAFLSLLIAAFMLVSVLPASLPVFAEAPSARAALVYSTESNSGTRDVICTTLQGTRAEAYYGEYYSYDELSALSDKALYNELNSLLTTTHKKNSSYDDCRDMAVKTDCENNDGRINLLYSSVSVTKGDYNNGRNWNREHVWPKSLGNFGTSGPGADLHHIRPADSVLNSTRNNNKYGNVSGGSEADGGTLVGGMVGGYVGGGYFEPLDNAKGDVARMCLYMYVRYGTSASYSCDKITNVFQSVEVLLEWCELDPVDTWEMGRNEVIAAYQGNRNVFIDYPEYAWLIFGEDIPSDMQTPSGEASNGTSGEGGNQGGTGGGNQGGTTTPPEECQHTSTEIRNAVNVSCGSNSAGYTGDTYCADCGTFLYKGQSVSASDYHKYGNDGACSCGAISPILIGDTAYITYKKDSTLYELTGVNTSNVGTQASYTGAPSSFPLTVEKGVSPAGTDYTTVFLKTPNGKYLGYQGTKNSLYELDKSTNDANNLIISWIPHIDAQGTFRLINAASPDRELQYNISSPRFCCYTSTQKPITIVAVRPEIVEFPEIVSFGLTLNDAVTVRVNYNISAAWLAENPNAELVFENDLTTTVLTPSAGINTYTFTLTPGAINNALSIKLYAQPGAAPLDENDVSVSAYEERIWNIMDAENFDILGSEEKGYALLYLLEAIDIYANAADKTLKNDLTEEFYAVEDPIIKENIDVFGNISAVLSEQASVKLNINTGNIADSYMLNVKLGNKTLVSGIALTEYINPNKQLVINGLCPLDFDEDILITISNGGDTVATITFTFNAYLKALYNSASDTDVLNLVAATYQYGCYAEAYNVVY